jgi:FixJ family two-component response regulator
VLLDINLPDGIGLDVMREGLISRDCGVIVMTAQGGVECGVEALRLGAVDFLAKPFDFSMLPLVMKRARLEAVFPCGDHEREAESALPFSSGRHGTLKAQLEKILAADLVEDCL